MILVDKIKELYNRGVFISLDEDDLIINSDSTIEQHDMDWLRKNKQELIQYFKSSVLEYASIPTTLFEIDYALSSAQKRLWVLSKFEDTDNKYSIFETYYIHGSIDESAFSSAYNNLLQRHEVLRTVFSEDEQGNPRQRILPITDERFSIHIKDYSNDTESSRSTVAEQGLITEQQREDTIQDYVQQEIATGFDLEQGPLVRCSLLKETDSSYVWVLVMHHIVSDGWSMGVLHKEFSEFYNASLEQRSPELEPLSIQYKDYAAWHNAQLNAVDIKIHKEYWLEQFKGELPVLELPSDKSRPKVMTYNGASIYKELDKKVTDQLKAFSQQQGGTLFMALQTALNILLHKYTGQEDIVIGSPIAGREHPDLEEQIGFYINTLALRTQFSKEDTVDVLYQKIKHNTLGAYSHQVYPYDELVDDLKLTRDMSHNPLFDVMLVLQSIEEGADNLDFSNATLQPYVTNESDYEVAKFDLSFGFEEHSEGMYYSLNYNTDIYSEEQVSRMLSHLEHLLRTISSQKQTAITEYDILTKEEKTYLLETLNDTQVDYPKDKTLVDLFEDQEEKTPDAVAIKFKDTELTYRELNEKSNQLAHYLIKNYNIQPDDLVGIELERSEWMVIGILAIIKSGGAYVPIDPEYPEQRKSFIMEDARLKFIVDEDELSKFNTSKEFNEYPITNPNIELSPYNLMYVIYTSGSTGNPKGVLVEHGAFVNINNAYFGSKLRCTLTCNYNFDVSVLEIFSTLTSGAVLYIPELDIIEDIDQYMLFLKKNNIDTAYLHPFWIDSHRFYPKSLKNVLVGVEPIYYQSLSSLFTDDRMIINGYGPTESTICSSFYNIIEIDNKLNKLPIGTPIQNTETYLLDCTHHLVPYGSIGEICIGGVGLARGYLNREELTKEKFITNPYDPTERLYRTGDLGRWREDGNLEYLGRMDDQVKIRGYRIELGEVEQAISSHPQSGHVVVIARAINTTADKELIAYTTGEATAEELKAYLKESLPSYMVPNYYVRLETIPFTSNGKVDRKALPDPEGTGLQQGAYFAPRTETEKQLVRIWSTVLGAEENTLSIKADFFDLGGHSIKAIRLLGQVHKQLGVKIALKELFTHPTIDQLGKLINASSEQEEYTSITSIEEQEDYAVSSAQRRLWVLSRFEGASEAYNIPQVVRLEGSIDETAFTKAYENLLTRHEVLRTVFSEDEEGNPRQRILPVTDECFTIQIKDYSNTSEQNRSKEQIAAEIQEYVQQEISIGFDLAQGPLIRCSLLKEIDTRYVWVLVMHHIVSDGWSMGVLHKEFSELYNAALEQRTPALEPLSIQYKDYAAWHNAQLQSEEINTHKSYWLDQFKGELPVLELPSDKPRPKVMTYNGGRVYRELDKQTTEGLKAFSQDQGGTLFMTMQTALNILLHKYTGQEDIVIGSPIAGREHPDLEGQIGFYLGALPIRTTFSKEETVADLYQRIRQNTLDAYNHQVYPYDELVDALKLTRDTSRNPLFDVWLDYHSQEIESEGVSFSQIHQNEYFLSTTDHQTKFDITLVVQEQQGGGLGVYWEYNRDIYNSSQMEQMERHFSVVLSALALQATILLRDYALLSTEDTDSQLTHNPPPSTFNQSTVIELFKEAVYSYSDQPALVDGNKQLSYKELDEQSNRLAHYLAKEHGVTSGDVVGIKLDRSIAQVVSVLGVLKSGAAYVPIDTSYPKERIAFMEKDSCSKVIIAEEEWDQFNLQRTLYSTESPAVKVTPEDAMYVIYTSGSTGTPKGCVLNYEGVSNYLDWTKEYSRDITYSEVDFFSSLSFDFTVTSLFGALTEGKTLRIYDSKEDLSSQLKQIVFNQESGWIKLTPAHINLIDEQTLQSARSKVFVLGGEALTEEQIKHLRKNQGCRIYNEYGPTESTVGCIVKEISEDNEPFIGTPIPNSEVYLTDSTHHLVPYGSIGEICIGGVGLARGYLNRPQLTKEKFITNPYNPTQRLYRTGDLGRWREDGNLEYLGRMDDQVKIRGYRIELGEIEQAISTHPQSGQVVVIARAINTTADKELIAYTTGEATADELKAYLKESLPSYMVPNYYVRLESIPLTSNGKVDRKALPDPEGTGMQQATYIAPSTETEKKLVKIWSEVLGTKEEEIGLYSDFFALGGDSIKAIRLIHLVESQLNSTVKIAHLLQNNVLKDFVKMVEINKSNSEKKFKQAIEL